MDIPHSLAHALHSRPSPRLTSHAAIALVMLLLHAPISYAGGQLQIVAHEDDDLYFMSPAVPDGISAGEASWTVFVTAGDAALGASHWMSREAGMQAAYAAMAGVADAWTTSPIAAGGKTLHSVILQGNPDIRLVFLRLPDGFSDGNGDPVTGSKSLRKLWDGSELTAETVDSPSVSYTRSELLDTLRDIIVMVDPEVLRIQDMSYYHGNDHSDHVHAGRFALNAHFASNGSHRLLAYRAYNVANESVNLSDEERADALFYMETYAYPHDPGAIFSQSENWLGREIPIADIKDTNATLVSVSGTSAGLCLNVSDAGGPSETLSFATCADTVEQSLLFTPRDIRHGIHCLATPALGGVPNSLGFRPCGVGSGQAWTFFSDGHIRGPDDQCLGTSGGSLTVTTCGTVADDLRVFEVGATPGFAAGVGSDFSADEFDGDPARYGSLAFGDVDGDGDEDACARRDLGIECAIALGNGLFGPATPWHPNFGDDDNWGPVEFGSTIEMGDVDGDGLADLCGRGGLGVYCVTSTGTSFEDFRLWTTFFSNTDGGDQAEVYSSLKLGDVDGDADDDLCGHRAGTVQCALSSGSAFDPPTVWADTAWNADLDLPAHQRGRTMMLGDIDGDGAEDLCERGTDGVFCAISDPVGLEFVDRAMRSQDEYSDPLGWSAPGQFYWRTVRLGDFSGDGLADICGRGIDGALCLYSLAGRFSAPNHLLSPNFSNSAGFGSEERSVTFAMADIDGDGRADLCGAGATALECAVVPEPGFAAGLALASAALAGGVRRRARRGTFSLRRG